MRHGFIHKTAAHAFLWVGELVIIEIGGHQPLLGKGERYARGVAGDPAPAPLLGDIGGCAGAAGGVEDQVAGIGGHEEAAGNDTRIRLNNIFFGFSKTASNHVLPYIMDYSDRKIRQVAFKAK